MKKQLALLVLVALFAGCSSPETPITLTYNPPDGMSFGGYTVSNRVQQAMGNTSVDSTVTFSSHALTANDSGWTLRTVTDSILKGIAGPAVSDQMNQMLIGHEFTQILDRTGHAVAMTGYDLLFTRIDSALGPEQARMVRATMGPELLSKREIKEWNSTIPRFAALGALTPGRWIYDSTSVELPSGAALTYFQATRLLDTLQYNGKLCARVEVAAHTDPAKLAELIKVAPKDICGRIRRRCRKRESELVS
jgi:hypothetical protein